MEREWTKALCGADTAALASLNAAMKRIDLACLIASPIMVGLLMQHRLGAPPMVAATLALLTWNLVAWGPEVVLLRYAQRRSAALAADKPLPGAAGGAGAHGCSWRPLLLACQWPCVACATVLK